MTAMKSTIEHTWRTLCHQATCQETSRYIRDDFQFPMRVSTAEPWVIVAVDAVMKQEMELLIKMMRPVINGHNTIYGSMSSFWMMVLQDLRDIVSHRDDIRDLNSVTPFTEDLNPARAMLTVPSHGHFSIPVNKVSNVLSLDTCARCRIGENMLVKVDAHTACMAMLDAVLSVLVSFRDIALSSL